MRRRRHPRHEGYLTTLSDNTRTASGNDVTLDPATPFAMDWYMKSGTSLQRLTSAPRDPTFRAARRTVGADESGRGDEREAPHCGARPAA